MPALPLASIYSILTWLFFPPTDFSHSSSLFYFPEGQADLHARRKTEPRGSRPAERRWCALNLEAKLTNMCLLHNMQCRKTKTLLTKVKGLELACSRKLRVDQFKYIVSILAHVSLHHHCLVSVSADHSSIRWTFLMMQTGLLSCSSNGSDGCCLHLLSLMAASALSCGQWAHPPRSCTAEFDLGREWVLKF